MSSARPSRFPSAMFVSVDLPMPGDPPSSTSEPGTSPPPSTRSSSPMPVSSRACFSARDLCEPRGPARGRARRRARPFATGLPRVSSVSVSTRSQPGHCPIQRGVSAAQAEQTKTVDARGHGLGTVGANPDGSPPSAVKAAGRGGGRPRASHGRDGRGRVPVGLADLSPHNPTSTGTRRVVGAGDPRPDEESPAHAGLGAPAPPSRQ